MNHFIYKPNINFIVDKIQELDDYCRKNDLFIAGQLANDKSESRYYEIGSKKHGIIYGVIRISDHPAISHRDYSVDPSSLSVEQAVKYTIRKWLKKQKKKKSF